MMRVAGTAECRPPGNVRNKNLRATTDEGPANPLIKVIRAHRTRPGSDRDRCEGSCFLAEARPQRARRFSPINADRDSQQWTLPGPASQGLVDARQQFSPVVENCLNILGGLWGAHHSRMR